MVSSFEAFEKATELDPANPEIWLKWSWILFEQGDYEKANQLVQEGIDETPEEADLYYRAVLYLIQAGHFKEAFINLETALTLDYDGHVQLYEYFTNLETQKALHKIIEQYRK